MFESRQENFANRLSKTESRVENLANSFSAKPLILVSSKYNHKHSKGKTTHLQNTSKAGLSSYCPSWKIDLSLWCKKPRNIGMHIGIQNLLSPEQNINISLHKTYLDKFDKFVVVFQKKRFERFFLAKHRAAICRSRKNTAFWLADKNIFNPFC